tara:strand:+ start:561 stop:953 length:393 start_codon:yes stop_codon:yes gene_type:complete
MHQISEEDKAKMENALSENDESVKGSLNNPVDTQILKLQGKIKDGSEYGKRIIVLAEVSQSTGKTFYSIYEKKGVFFPAKENANGDKPRYAFSGNYNLDGKDKVIYAYDNESYYGLVLHDKEEKSEEQVL